MGDKWMTSLLLDIHLSLAQMIRKSRNVVGMGERFLVVPVRLLADLVCTMAILVEMMATLVKIMAVLVEWMAMLVQTTAMLVHTMAMLDESLVKWEQIQGRQMCR